MRTFSRRSTTLPFFVAAGKGTSHRPAPESKAPSPRRMPGSGGHHGVRPHEGVDVSRSRKVHRAGAVCARKSAVVACPSVSAAIVRTSQSPIPRAAQRARIKASASGSRAAKRNRQAPGAESLEAQHGPVEERQAQRFDLVFSGACNRPWRSGCRGPPWLSRRSPVTPPATRHRDPVTLDQRVQVVEAKIHELPRTDGAVVDIEPLPPGPWLCRDATRRKGMPCASSQRKKTRRPRSARSCRRCRYCCACRGRECRMIHPALGVKRAQACQHPRLGDHVIRSFRRLCLIGQSVPSTSTTSAFSVSIIGLPVL